MEEYWRHLKADGVLIVHVSNRYVKLQPIVNKLALEFNLDVALIESLAAEGLHISVSEWMILSKNATVLDHPSLAPHRIDPKLDTDASLWTDDYNDLIRVLRTP